MGTRPSSTGLGPERLAHRRGQFLPQAGHGQEEIFLAVHALGRDGIQVVTASRVEVQRHLEIVVAADFSRFISVDQVAQLG